MRFGLDFVGGDVVVVVVALVSLEARLVVERGRRKDRVCWI